jgi:hypothetical protein
MRVRRVHDCKNSRLRCDQCPALAALTAAGTPDGTINPGAANYVPLPQGASVTTLTADPADYTYAVGGFALGGASIPASTVLKFNREATLDPAFGDAGEATFPVDGEVEFFGVTLLGSNLYATDGVGVVKIGTNGILSTTWGAGGAIGLKQVDPLIGWNTSAIAASSAGVLVSGFKDAAVVLARLPL